MDFITNHIRGLVEKLLNALDLDRNGVVDKVQVMGIVDEILTAGKDLAASVDGPKLGLAAEEAELLAAQAKKTAGLLGEAVHTAEAKAAAKRLQGALAKLGKYIADALKNARGNK